MTHIWLNDQPIVFVPGMKVRQALIQANLIQEIEKGARVFDEWGNELGLDGALEDEMRYRLKSAEQY